jgi:hypothetical protein
MKMILTILIFVTFLKTFSRAESNFKESISANVKQPIEKESETAGKRRN